MTTEIIDNYNGRHIDPYDREKCRVQAAAAAADFVVPTGTGPAHSDPVPVVVDLQPGNGSRYVLVFTPIVGEAARRAVGNDWLLSLPEADRCYPIAIPGHQVVEYIQARWFPSIADATPVADFLHHLNLLIREAS